MTNINSVVDWVLRRTWKQIARALTVAALAALVLVLTVVTAAAWHPTRTPHVTAPTAVATTTASPLVSALASARPSPPSIPTAGPVATTDQHPAMGAGTTVVAFVRMWLAGRHLPTAAWIDGLKGVAVPDLVEALKTTDPHNLPDAFLVGGAPKVVSAGPGIANVQLSLSDGSDLIIWVVYDTSGWMVLNIGEPQ